MIRKLSFVCRVEYLHDDHASVTMHHRATGEVYLSDCALKPLSAARIGLGDEFLSVVTKQNKVKLRRLKPKPIPPERVKEIRAKFENRWE